MKIRGVIHMCQRGDWKRSLNMVLTEVETSGLLAASETIDLVILADGAPDIVNVNPKITCIYAGHPDHYERPTLLHLRDLALVDTEDVAYWYMHTKGIRHWGRPGEENVEDWIRMMLYWNTTRWKKAVAMLDRGYDTYGCNLRTNPRPHYSGNFWWARSSHLRTLPSKISPGYEDPEYWLLLVPAKTFEGYNSQMDHYDRRHPSSLYTAEWIDSILSAWTGHRDFARWITWTAKSDVIVELGVDYGYSTFVFADALKGTTGTIYGVDLFMGDIHTGHRSTLDFVKKAIVDHSVTNLELVIGEFDSISKLWNKPIDILHIDGLHTYDAVKNDFARWSPHVTENGIVLFHDIAVPEFGVKEFFRELDGGYKLFFLHSAGLGIWTRNKQLRDKIMIEFSANVYDFAEHGHFI